MPTYFTGHVRRPDKDFLIALSARRHRRGLQALLATPPPPTWDSTALGWVGPIKDQSSCGSCHDAATEVLTEKGWVGWPDYDWQAPLGTMNPLTGSLEFQVPLVRHVYDHDGPMYYYDGRSLDFALTPNHRMIWRRNKGPWGKSTIADLPRYADIPHSTTGWLGTELVELGVGGHTYDGDDLLALIALVISDGHVGWRDDGNGSRNSLTFCCFREGRVEQVRALAQRVGFSEQPSRPGVWNVRDGSLAEWFRQNAYDGGGYLAPHKRVPSLVKCASQRQIDHFLRFFGDQHTQSYGGRRFYSSSRLMIDDLQELLLRVGKRGTVEESPPRATHGNSSGRSVVGRWPELMLTERLRDALCVERENLRTDSYKGKVYCATVSNGSLVTRRNKRVLISSNCWDFSGTGMVESAYFKAGLLKPDGSGAMSEEYTLSCCRNGGCDGDDNVTVLDWAKSHGLPLTSDYGKYTGGPSRCLFKPQMTLYKVDDWGFCDPDPNNKYSVASVDSIKAAIMAYGVVGSAIAADNAFVGFNGGRVFHGSNRGINHDIILTGWDDNRDGGAWKLRNSWSPAWADQGYCWIAYGANQVGTEAVWCRVNAANPPIDWFA